MIQMSGAKKKLERRAVQAQMGLSEREKQELLKQKAQRRNNIIAVVGGVVAVALVVALLVWNTGFFDRHITAVKFAIADDNTAAVGKVNDLTLTRADMEYYYALALNELLTQEQNMAAMYKEYGLTYTMSFDPNSSLKTQYIDEAKTMSYHDYLVQRAMARATQTLALSNAAKATGHTLSEESQASLDNAATDLDANVEKSGFGNRSNFLRNAYGRATNEEVYFKNLERNIWAYDYSTAISESLNNYSDQDLETYYTDHADELDSYDYDYAYFDGTALPTTDADGNSVEPTDEDKAAALAKAKKNADDMLAALNAAPATDGEGDAQTKDFTTLASDFDGQAYTQAGNSGSTLINNDAPFAQWIIDAARADGDADVFEVEDAGYYVVQFHSRQRNDIPSTADVRHILIATSHEDDPDTADVDESQVPFTDEEVTAAHTEAERILQEFLSGEQTGERFGELAEQYSADRQKDGSLSSAGGLYAGIEPTDSYVQEFLDWIFTADRKVGDTGIVKTDYGYHIMFADAVEEVKWKADSRNAMFSADQQAFLEEVQAGYVISVDKWSKPTAQESAQPSAEGQEG